MVGTSTYTAEQIYFVLQRKREKRQTNHEIVEECKINWDSKDWEPKHVAYIFSKYQQVPEFAPRDPNDKQPIVRPKPQRKPRKPPVNPLSITKSPAIRKPPAKRQRKVTEALQAAKRLPLPTMLESEIPVAGFQEQFSDDMSELEQPANTTLRLPTMEEDGFSYIPNGQLGFDQFEHSLNQMNDDELNGYANRVIEDNRAGMQSHNQTAESYMDVDGQEETSYSQPMNPGQQNYNSGTWNQDLDQDQDINNLLHDDPHVFNNLSMPPHSDSSQNILDNTDGQVHVNYLLETLSFPPRPNTGNLTNRVQHQNLEGTAQNPNPVALMNHPMVFGNRTGGQHRNNGSDNRHHNFVRIAQNPNPVALMNHPMVFGNRTGGQHRNDKQSPRNSCNAYASQMRESTVGPMHATLNTPQPLKMLNTPFKPAMLGILRGSNDEPATGIFDVNSAQKRARDNHTPTLRSTSRKKRQRQGSSRDGQGQVGKTASQRHADFASRAGRRNAPSDTIAGSDESEHSYLRVSSSSEAQSDGGRNFEPSPIYQSKQITKSNSNNGRSGSQIHNPNKVNRNGQNTRGNGDYLSMSENHSSSVQDSKKRLNNRSAQQDNKISHRPAAMNSGSSNSGNGSQPTSQIVHQQRTANSGMSMHTTPSNLGNHSGHRNDPQIQRPRQNVNMDSRRSMSVASENLGNGQQPGREPQLQQPPRQDIANSNRSMVTASRNAGQAFVPPPDMPDPFTVPSGPNNLNSLPLPSSSNRIQQSSNTSFGNPQQNMGNRGFGIPGMTGQGFGYNTGMASMQNHQFQMMNQPPHPHHGLGGFFGPAVPGVFNNGHFVPLTNMHGNWGGPPGMMMAPNFNQFPQHMMNYSAMHPSQMPLGLPTPQMQMINAQYRYNVGLASHGGNQASAPPVYHPGGAAHVTSQGYVPNAPAGGLNIPQPNYIQQVQTSARNSVGGSNTSNAAPVRRRSEYDMAEEAGAYNGSQYGMAEASTSRVADAHALVDLQRGMAEETARTYSTYPSRTASNGIDMTNSPIEPLHVEISSNDILQPTPSRGLAASASLEAVLATSSAAQDTPRQEQGRSAQQVGQPSEIATELSEDDGEFELEDGSGQFYDFQIQPIGSYNQNSGPIEAGDHSDLERILSFD